MKNTPSSDPLPELLRPRAAARYLGIGATTLARWAREGKIAAPLKLGRLTAWRRVDLDSFIASLPRKGD